MSSSCLNTNEITPDRHLTFTCSAKKKLNGVGSTHILGFSVKFRNLKKSLHDMRDDTFKYIRGLVIQTF